MRSAFFWEFTLHTLLVADVSGQPIGPSFKSRAVQHEFLHRTARPQELTGRPATSGTNCQSMVRTTPKE
jgi:hypothetical protein